MLLSTILDSSSRFIKADYPVGGSSRISSLNASISSKVFKVPGCKDCIEESMTYSLLIPLFLVESL